MQKEYIQKYNDAGLVVIPIDWRSKAPSIKGWPDRKLDDFRAEEFEPPTNLGIVLGDSSGGLIDIDIDSDIKKRNQRTLTEIVGKDHS